MRLGCVIVYVNCLQNLVTMTSHVVWEDKRVANDVIYCLDGISFSAKQFSFCNAYNTLNTIVWEKLMVGNIHEKKIRGKKFLS